MTIIQSGQQILAREGTDTSQDSVYLLRSNEADIEDQFLDVAAWIQSSLPVTLAGEEYESHSTKEIGEGWWSVTARYSTERKDQKERQQEPEIGDEADFRFSIATESRTVKISRSLVSVTPSHADYTAHLNKPYPIGYDGKDVLGIDLPIPVASWEETFYFNPSAVTQNYRLTCLGLVGKVNNASFRGAAARQVLLTSIEGNKKAADPWVISFSFTYKADETTTFRMVDQEDRQVTTVGHQVLDVRYAAGKLAGVRCELPKLIFVQEVFALGDFSQLGIGT